LKTLVSGALICTAPATETDIYARCFLPRLGHFEETATPAIYPRLLQFWQQKMPKNSYKAVQGLMRRSEIHFMRREHYIWVGGNCRCYFRGELLL
jgi:predicted PhzF superfamily epimerase YddE/YHI9